LNLRFERLNEKQNEESEKDNNQEVAFLVVNLKENVEIVVRSGIKRKIVIKNKPKWRSKQRKSQKFSEKNE
jgi:hypothetical protein